MIEKKPFERHTFDEDYEKADIVSVRLNREERMMLNALKMSYNEKNDGTALKRKAFENIKQQMIYEDLLRNNRKM